VRVHLDTKTLLYHMRFRIISDSDTFTIVFLPIFYCMNVSVLVIQPPGCHNPINVMLLTVCEVLHLSTQQFVKDPFPALPVFS